jgi:hypothetical protein
MPPELFADALRAYLTQYVGLGLVFLFGLVVAYRAGDVGFTTARQRRWLLVVGGGMLVYAAAHGFLQFVAPSLQG